MVDFYTNVLCLFRANNATISLLLLSSMSWTASDSDVNTTTYPPAPPTPASNSSAVAQTSDDNNPESTFWLIVWAKSLLKGVREGLEQVLWEQPLPEDISVGIRDAARGLLGATVLVGILQKWRPWPWPVNLLWMMLGGFFIFCSARKKKLLENVLSIAGFFCVAYVLHKWIGPFAIWLWQEAFR
ncbi:hypothetical protein B0H13DRAFT_981671 [Mycena leptocephala]|nr:hypothetical protein B0H13DRAFT_981671 [Mycena leptocephala]